MVIGPVIMLIGLSLAGTGVNMASGWILGSLLSLLQFWCPCLRGLLKLIPILPGIVGYVAAVIAGKVDFTGIAEAVV